MMAWIGGLIEASGNPATPTALVFKGYDSGGGSCNALTQQTNITNLFFEYNVITNLEEGIKGVKRLAAPNLYVIQTPVLYNE